MRVEVMLYVYLFVCAAMIAFNIVAAVIFRMDGRRTERIGRGLYRRVSEQLGRGEAVDRHHIRYLCRKLRRTGNMIAFDKMLESVYAERPREARDYLRSIDEVFVSLMISYARRDRIEAAYFPYIIRKYRVIAHRRFPSIENALLDMLSERSIYCRENALQALYTTGDVECVIKAIEILDKSELFFHGKLLCDGLLDFAGDRLALGNAVIGVFPSLSPEMQVTMLDYLRFSGGEYREFALSLLQDEHSGEELRYACIRYLGKYRYDKAYPVLCLLAQEDAGVNWQYAAIASTALGAYPGAESVRILKSNLFSKSWYIRCNSAESLKRLGVTYSELADVIDGSDRYASEMIRYCLLRGSDAEKGVLS